MNQDKDLHLAAGGSSLETLVGGVITGDPRGNNWVGMMEVESRMQRAEERLRGEETETLRGGHLPLERFGGEEERESHETGPEDGAQGRHSSLFVPPRAWLLNKCLLHSATLMGSLEIPERDH